MKKELQAKHIPDKPILDFLANIKEKDPNSLGAGYSTFSRYNLMEAVPEGTPVRLFLAKMHILIRRGLVTGCTCGCRGDFQLK